MSFTSKVIYEVLSLLTSLAFDVQGYTITPDSTLPILRVSL